MLQEPNKEPIKRGGGSSDAHIPSAGDTLFNLSPDLTAENLVKSLDYQIIRIFNEGIWGILCRESGDLPCKTDSWFYYNKWSFENEQNKIRRALAPIKGITVGVQDLLLDDTRRAIADDGYGYRTGYIEHEAKCLLSFDEQSLTVLKAVAADINTIVAESYREYKESASRMSASRISCEYKTLQSTQNGRTVQKYVIDNAQREIESYLENLSKGLIIGQERRFEVVSPSWFEGPYLRSFKGIIRYYGEPIGVSAVFDGKSVKVYEHGKEQSPGDTLTEIFIRRSAYRFHNPSSREPLFDTTPATVESIHVKGGSKVRSEAEYKTIDGLMTALSKVLGISVLENPTRENPAQELFAALNMPAESIQTRSNEKMDRFFREIRETLEELAIGKRYVRVFDYEAAATPLFKMCLSVTRSEYAYNISLRDTLQGDGEKFGVVTGVKSMNIVLRLATAAIAPNHYARYNAQLDDFLQFFGLERDQFFRSKMAGKITTIDYEGKKFSLELNCYHPGTTSPLCQNRENYDGERYFFFRDYDSGYWGLESSCDVALCMLPVDGGAVSLEEVRALSSNIKSRYPEKFRESLYHEKED